MASQRMEEAGKTGNGRTAPQTVLCSLERTSGRTDEDVPGRVYYTTKLRVITSLNLNDKQMEKS